MERVNKLLDSIDGEAIPSLGSLDKKKIAIIGAGEIINMHFTINI
jgi:glutamyl-tRNA reductase